MLLFLFSKANVLRLTPLLLPLAILLVVYGQNDCNHTDLAACYHHGAALSSSTGSGSSVSLSMLTDGEFQLLTHLLLGFATHHGIINIFGTPLWRKVTHMAVGLGPVAHSCHTLYRAFFRSQQHVHYTLLGVTVCIIFGVVCQVPLRMLLATRLFVIAATVAVHLQQRNAAGGAGAGAGGAGAGFVVDDAVFLGVLGCWVNMLVVAWFQDSWHTDIVSESARLEAKAAGGRGGISSSSSSSNTRTSDGGRGSGGTSVSKSSNLSNGLNFNAGHNKTLSIGQNALIICVEAACTFAFAAVLSAPGGGGGGQAGGTNTTLY